MGKEMVNVLCCDGAVGGTNDDNVVEKGHVLLPRAVVLECLLVTDIGFGPCVGICGSLRCGGRNRLGFWRAGTRARVLHPQRLHQLLGAAHPPGWTFLRCTSSLSGEHRPLTRSFLVGEQWGEKKRASGKELKGDEKESVFEIPSLDWIDCSS